MRPVVKDKKTRQKVKEYIRKHGVYPPDDVMKKLKGSKSKSEKTPCDICGKELADLPRHKARVHDDDDSAGKGD